MKRVLYIILALVALGGIYIGYWFYSRIFLPNVDLKGEQFILYIPSGEGFNAVKDSLIRNNVLRDVKSFEWVAGRKNYTANVKPGRYVIPDKMSNQALVNKLRSGVQDPVNLTLHDISGVYELSGKLSQKLEGDSLDFLEYLSSEENLKEFDLVPHTATAYFLPNTYEFYWNTSPRETLQRMQKEFNRFWTEERRKKAEDIGLTPVEVVTLASIVESETVQASEKPEVAGLYYNRLQQGMKLQSDPTVIYAINVDYPERVITRVYYKDLSYDSPYNTYFYKGLPPGPIKIPSLSTIDAVLNYKDHNYLYMVADPARPGYHNFAETLRQHNLNRRKYIRWLDAQE